ncbi:MAG: enoyl-CoA hydratase/isomerase family protein [Proteobacteria bacterium]|nr:enoyl-CoA hydratase/isomerase family protein [Pseudomonadota bacterium]
MSYEFIKVEKQDHITIITINRPEVMNSLHPYTSIEMDKAFNDFADDPDQWIGILTGAGDKAFSAGNDLKFQAQHGGEKIRELTQGLRGGFGGITYRFDLFKPLIAAVNGLALGGGFECALACDIIIASEKASFGLPEPTVGLMAGAGGVHRLPRAIPHYLAMSMMLTAKRIYAQEARELGLVAEIVPPDKLMEAALDWAKRIMACSPLAIRASKEATLKGLGMSLEEACKTTFPGQVTMHKSEDFIEGPKAFAEKRKPQWKGR